MKQIRINAVLVGALVGGALTVTLGPATLAAPTIEASASAAASVSSMSTEAATWGDSSNLSWCSPIETLFGCHTFTILSDSLPDGASEETQGASIPNINRCIWDPSACPIRR